MNQPWQIQPGETPKAFAAFHLYREQTQPRSVLEAYRRSDSGRVAAKVPPGHWDKWCSRNSWVQRVEAWENHLVHVEQVEIEKEQAKRARLKARRAIEVEEAEWAARELMIKKANEMAAFPLAQITREVDRQTETLPDGTHVTTTTTQVINPTRWAFRDIARLQDTASKLGRLSTGMEVASEAAEINVNLSVNASYVDRINAIRSRRGLAALRPEGLLRDVPEHPH